MQKDTIIYVTDQRQKYLADMLGGEQTDCRNSGGIDYERVGNVTTEGTIINRAAMLSIQGFEPSTITVNADGSITETNSKGQTLKTSISDNGEVTEVFSGVKTVTKTTKCSNGNLVEVMS